jgi:hypothetical protein
MKKHRWYILITLLSAILVLVIGWKPVVGCTYCWLGGDLSVKGSFPYKETPAWDHFAEHCKEDTSMGLEFRISHECRKDLKEYWLEIYLDYTIYSGPFKDPLVLEDVRRCREWNENLIITLSDRDDGSSWAWSSYLTGDLQGYSQFEILLYGKRRFPHGEDKAYFEYQLDAR